MLPMTRLKENKARERRIEMEVVVDAYNALERAMGWYYYLEERLKFPFKARCRSKRETSPLHVGEEVEVVGMAAEKECESEVFVRLRWRGARLALPLSQLEPLAAKPKTKEAVADWQYWVVRGYEF
jgi:hypothetical protein